MADLTAVPRLLAVVASRTGNLLNFADLSSNLGLPQTPNISLTLGLMWELFADCLFSLQSLVQSID
jgi:hypothetical protein